MAEETNKQDQAKPPAANKADAKPLRNPLLKRQKQKKQSLLN